MTLTLFIPIRFAVGKTAEHPKAAEALPGRCNRLQCGALAEIFSVVENPNHANRVDGWEVAA